MFDVDSEIVIQGGEDFLEMDGAVFCMFAESIGGADDLTGFHTTAGE